MGIAHSGAHQHTGVVQFDAERLGEGYRIQHGPAIIDGDGNKYWFWRDKQHRDGDPQHADPDDEAYLRPGRRACRR